MAAANAITDLSKEIIAEHKIRGNRSPTVGASPRGDKETTSSFWDRYEVLVSRVGAPRRRAGLRGLSPPLRLVQTFLVETRHRAFNLKSTSKQREPSQHFWCATIHNRYRGVCSLSLPLLLNSDRVLLVLVDDDDDGRRRRCNGNRRD
ncbi:hypothetical protein EVAR_65045_1 [Eumeta japonica]|uniref:Uncharacterized protein n=1 Tax=Eumeta variegata TaxID=151549 RepID=A0A4C1ZR18_EUMVA|nr:hypothetical protein EVAR_65045_1 [Eumeta japonica]